MKPEPTESREWTQSETWGQITDHAAEPVRFGHVLTPDGIVEVRGYNYTGVKISTIEFIHGGQRYYWSWPRFYSKRFLVTLARRAAREIVAESGKRARERARGRLA